MNLEHLGQWLSTVDEQTKQIDCSKIPVEAEVHIAFIRNRLAQIQPDFLRMIEKVHEIQYHYHMLFEVLFSGVPQEVETVEEEDDSYTDEEYEEIMDEDWEDE